MVALREEVIDEIDADREKRVKAFIKEKHIELNEAKERYEGLLLEMEKILSTPIDEFVFPDVLRYEWETGSVIWSKND